MNIFLLGGSGFIGTRCIEQLLKNKIYHLSIFDKKVPNTEFTLYKKGDLLVYDDLKNAINDDGIIINLIAEHRDDVTPISQYDLVNVQGARHICQVARERSIHKIIFTSSMAVYGFALPGTGEDGVIAPFNDYGRTKYEAEQVYMEWLAENPEERSLTIIRSTVVFGEHNRGNVYNLLRQIASGRFIMVGNGNNRKSMVYVENLAAFIEHCLSFGPGLHLYNYVDKPDFSMNEFVSTCNQYLGKGEQISFRLPYVLGLSIGKVFDIIACVTGKKFAFSSIRVKKFCTDSTYTSKVSETGFIPPVTMEEALERTITYEFKKRP